MRNRRDSALGLCISFNKHTSAQWSHYYAYPSSQTGGYNGWVAPHLLTMPGYRCTDKYKSDFINEELLCWFPVSTLSFSYPFHPICHCSASVGGSVSLLSKCVSLLHKGVYSMLLLSKCEFWMSLNVTAQQVWVLNVSAQQESYYIFHCSCTRDQSKQRSYSYIGKR